MISSSISTSRRPPGGGEFLLVNVAMGSVAIGALGGAVVEAHQFDGQIEVGFAAGIVTAWLVKRRDVEIDPP